MPFKYFQITLVQWNKSDTVIDMAGFDLLEIGFAGKRYRLFGYHRTGNLYILNFFWLRKGISWETKKR